jgi:hypothetical protein
VAKRYYAALHAVCKGNGLGIEGMVPGLATVCHHEDSDLRALFDAALNAAGLDASLVILAE